MARTVLPIAGAIIGAYFGAPQVGFMIGSLAAGAIPTHSQGPRIGETGAQTSAEGAPRAIVYATAPVTGNVICAGPLIKGDISESAGKGGNTTSSEHCYRTFAIRICEGPIGGVLRIWEDDKLVYDVRVGSTMLAESAKWIFGCGIYLGTETQLPDTFLQTQVTADMPAYRGTAYMVFVFRDLTDRRGSIPQYRFEVARQVSNNSIGNLIVGPAASSGYFTTLSINDSQQPMQIMNQTGGSPPQGVDFPGSYQVVTYDKTDFATVVNTAVIVNAGNSDGDNRIWPIAIDSTGGYAVGLDGNSGYCELLAGGSRQANLVPSGAPNNWWYNEGGYYPEYGGLIWFYGNAIYLGARKIGSSGVVYDSIYKFPKAAVGNQAQSATVAGITGDPSNPVFWMNVSRQGFVRSIAINGSGAMKTYDGNLTFVSSTAIPAAMAAYVSGGISQFWGFGVDEARGFNVFVVGSSPVAYVYDNAGNLLASKTLTGASAGAAMTRVMFTDTAIWIQRRDKTYRIDAPQTFSGVPMTLGDVVAEIHDRCGFPAAKRDVSELTDPVAGLVLAGEYTGADAINTLRSPYFFDKVETGKTLTYPKRGKAVVGTLTIDDLVEIPDDRTRQQAAEYPKKFHLFYQHAGSGYARVKATSARSSPDVRVTGETSAEIPVVMIEDQAAQAANMMHKVAWAEAEGEITLAVPESFLKWTPGDNIGLSLRGRVNRLRIEKAEHADGVLHWTLKTDRQSAYTSTVTGVPIPPPTLPPPTITGDTQLAVMDIPGRVDNEDDLSLYYAVSGAMPAWHGSTVQRSTDAGANYSNVLSIDGAAVMGSLVNPITAASEHYTDTTNVVRVQLYVTTQTIDAITNAQFLSEQGAFALQNADGSWEVLQRRDVTNIGGGIFDLKVLHRGRLNSGATAKVAGAVFVMLDDAKHVAAQSSWIGQSLTHRAPSYDQAQELATAQARAYVGRSQTEWPVASFALTRSGNNVTGTWAPRHRFGTDDAPIASVNFQGYRVTIVGTSTVTFDQTARTFTYDVSAIGGAVTVSVAAINRITGAGPATSGAI